VVGKEPLVVVFFATWCELCARKVKTVRRATSAEPGAKVLYVAVDGDDTKDHVPGFMREQRLSFARVMDGLAHPEFLRLYNPSQSIPLVAVVGRSGRLVDMQVGLRSGDGRKLEAALRRARED
jgi:hypothetical protein